MSFFLIALIAAIVSQGLSMLWYMPLFGMKWAQLHNLAIPQNPEDRKMKGMAWYMVIGFIMNYIMAAVLFLFLGIFGAFSFGTALPIAGVLFLGFVIPFVVNGPFWKNLPARNEAGIIGINFGYQVIQFLVWIALFAWLA